MFDNYSVFEIIITSAIIIFVTAVFAGTVVNRIIKRKKQLAELESGDYEPNRIEEHIARINFKDVVIVNTGINTPEHYLDFFAIFEFNGKETKLSVPESRYDGLTVGSTGTLLTENGNFLDFVTD